MIGNRAVLNDLMFPAIFAFILCGAIILALSHRGTVPAKRKVLSLIAATLLLGLQSAIGIARVYYQGRRIADITEIAPAEINAIQIGDKSFRNPAEIESIVNPLRHTVYFSPSHGGWGAETTLTIVSKSGQSHPLRVARYLRQSGAVLIFFHQSGDGTSIEGYGFAPDLPAALDHVGAALAQK